jgi:drug/metabolite transporter (DMT)-like permease
MLALGTAAGAGSADYLGAHFTRRGSALRVAGAIQLFGLLPVALVLLAEGARSLSASDLQLSLLAGISIAIGIASLYRALALGPMGVTAPTAAVLGAAIPVGAAIATGEVLTPVQLAGLLLGFASIVLFASGHIRRPAGARGGAVAFALLAGLGIGSFTLGIEATSPDAGLWPVAIGRAIAASSLLLLAHRRETGPAGEPMASWRLWAAGILDGMAVMLFMLGLRTGHVAVVAVVAALYPAFTVALATIIDRERLEIAQRFGLVVAFLAIMMISG